MTTERMIRAVEAVADKHKNDFVPTCQTNITGMCRDVIPKLELLAAYEQIGTVEEIKEILHIISEGQEDVDESGISTGLLHTLLKYAKYEKIGTVEECRQARERQMAKRPLEELIKRRDGRTIVACHCPRCGKILLIKDEEESQVFDVEKVNYCWDCGREIDWGGI